MFVIPTLAASHLGTRLDKYPDIEVVSPALNRDRKQTFPDGEVYAAIPEAKKMKEKRVVVLHSGAPAPNEGLVHLELILQILRDSGVKPEVFFSYFPYGMQDTVFDPGETNMAENLVAKLVSYYKVKRIYIVDAHFWGRRWVKKYPIEHLSAVPLLLERAREDYGERLIIVSADKGGKRRTGITGMEKKRRNSYVVEMDSPEEMKRRVNGRVVAVVDDLVKSGGTLVKFSEECGKCKAADTIALLTHGLLSSGVRTAKQTFSKVYLTNTINRSSANVDITPLIHDTLLLT